MKTTEQIRDELNMTNPNYRLAGHMTAKQLDCLEERIADLERAGRDQAGAGKPGSAAEDPPEPAKIRAPEAEVPRTRKARR